MSACTFKLSNQSLGRCAILNLVAGIALGFVVGCGGNNAASQDPSTPGKPGVASNAPKSKAFRTAEGLFDNVPKDAYPKAGSTGGAEREDFRKWLKEKFVPGQELEWEASVVDVRDVGAGPYTVSVDLKIPLVTGLDVPIPGWVLGKPISLGGQPCLVMARTPRVLPHYWGCAIVTYEGCTRDELNALRKLKEKKTVIVSGKVAAVPEGFNIAGVPSAALIENVTDFPLKPGDIGKPRTGELGIVLSVPVVLIDGFLPAASKTENKLSPSDSAAPSSLPADKR